MQEGKWHRKKEDWGEIGELKADKKADWVFGSFRELESLAKTEDFEFKYWSFKKGEKAHEPKFQVLATEYNFIIRGKIKGKVGNREDIVLGTGDYIVIKPGEIINLQEEVLENAEGITIKVPSRHGDTIKKSFIKKLLE